MEKDLNYLLIKSGKRKKTICLQVRRDGAVVVQAPVRTSKSEIETFLEEKKEWLKKRMLEQREKNRECRERSFVTGETFLLLGAPYPLQVLHSFESNGNRAPLSFTEGCFVLRRECVPRGKILFSEWYRERASDHIIERVRSFSSALGCFPLRVRIGNAECRWGSCSADNRLSFSWRLIMAPPPVIDYVVLHEIAHLMEKNHSRRFWNILEAIMPDYRRHRLWLNENGHLLKF
jgi:predicted metal-dependent hydrolase